MTAHTPGPWIVRNGVFIDAPTMRDVAQVRGVGASEGVLNPDLEIVANARLIAAAPDLLAAVSNLLDQIENGAPFTGKASDMQRNSVEQARQAITKAAG